MSELKYKTFKEELNKLGFKFLNRITDLDDIETDFYNIYCDTVLWRDPLIDENSLNKDTYICQYPNLNSFNNQNQLYNKCNNYLCSINDNSIYCQNHFREIKDTYKSFKTNLYKLVDTEGLIDYSKCNDVLNYYNNYEENKIVKDTITKLVKRRFKKLDNYVYSILLLKKL